MSEDIPTHCSITGCNRRLEARKPEYIDDFKFTCYACPEHGAQANKRDLIKAGAATGEADSSDYWPPYIFGL